MRIVAKTDQLSVVVRSSGIVARRCNRAMVRNSLRERVGVWSRLSPTQVLVRALPVIGWLSLFVVATGYALFAKLKNFPVVGSNAVTWLLALPPPYVVGVFLFDYVLRTLSIRWGRRVSDVEFIGHLRKVAEEAGIHHVPDSMVIGFRRAVARLYCIDPDLVHASDSGGSLARFAFHDAPLLLEFTMEANRACGVADEPVGTAQQIISNRRSPRFRVADLFVLYFRSVRH